MAQLQHALLKWMNLISRTIKPSAALSKHSDCTKLVNLQSNLTLIQTLDEIICRSMNENESTSEETSRELLGKIVNNLEGIYHYRNLSALLPSADGTFSESQIQKIVQRTLACAMLFGSEEDKKQYAEHIMQLEEGPQICLMKCIQVRHAQATFNSPNLNWVLCQSHTRILRTHCAGNHKRVLDRSG